MGASLLLDLVPILFAAGCALTCAYMARVLSNSVGPRGSAKVDRLEETSDQLKHAWTVAKAELEELHEVVERSLESVEKKRRQTTAAASRAKAANGEPGPDLNDSAQILAHATRLGILG